MQKNLFKPNAVGAIKLPSTRRRCTQFGQHPESRIYMYFVIPSLSFQDSTFGAKMYTVQIAPDFRPLVL